MFQVSCQYHEWFWSSMTIFIFKKLTRNPEIGNTPVWILPNIWRLGRVRDAKFGTNVSNKKLLNAAKCQGYSRYRFSVIKTKPTRGGNYLPPPTPRLGLKETHHVTFLSGTTSFLKKRFLHLYCNNYDLSCFITLPTKLKIHNLSLFYPR